MLPDQQARDDAVNPTLSAIVQAPAGSGKTEILTRRFLNLLLTVKAPEHVIALTFTRKAAHEMRERILDRLKSNEKVLAHDKTHQWNLLKNPNRLRITTIDSLCASLTKALPLTPEHLPFVHTTDTPETLYWEAARNCLNYALNTAAYQNAIQILLTHLDNRIDTLLHLFVEQLRSRDQWLRPVLFAKMQTKTHLESALKTIEVHALTQFKATLPDIYIDELISLSRSVATIENNPESPRFALTAWRNLDELDAKLAHALAALLLTSQKKLRKSFDHHVGLKHGACPKSEYKHLKTESKALLEALAQTAGFTDALLRIRALPTPEYPDSTWEPLQALLQLLPLLASHLQLTIESHQASDFTGITQQALDALGDDESPTDLALHLDYTIKHLLIDEFQDTSIQQFELVTRLTRGFETHDGRTLFVVGDPMQSIYRFRAAEVGLFLRAQTKGIGTTYLTPLHLTVNFRTRAPLIDWVNSEFQSIFPQDADIESGAVAFHKSIPSRPALDTDTPLHAQCYESKDAEADAIAKLCLKQLELDSNETIAILVRSRNQLPAITNALDSHGVSYQGLDTDLIAQLPHVKDVWSLTLALLMPPNRLYWLAFLRSPFAGFSLSDIYLLATHKPDDALINSLLDNTCLQKLSHSGRARAPFIRNVLETALNTRHQYPLVTWILNTLKALHLESVLSSREIQDLEPFFELLDSFEQDGLLSALDLFEQALYKRYTKVLGDTKVQLMTIHKAKGLEFDTVILPGLGRRSPVKDKPLMRWLTLPSEESEPLMLISPLNKTHGARDLIYDYLGELDTEKDRYEQSRLLYVAVTRAKERLYCMDYHEKAYAHTFRARLSQTPFEPITQSLTGSVTNMLPARVFLPDTFYDITKLAPPIAANNPPTKLTEPNFKRMLGVITHELIEWISNNHPQSMDDIPWCLVPPHYPDDALTQVKSWIKTLLEHPKGQWITQKHSFEQNEYELLVETNGRITTRIIDRVFEASNSFWVIDFKTGEKGSNHKFQLNQYAHALRTHTKKPIHCGLFYLDSGDWVEWEPTPKYAIMHEIKTEAV